ncbi:unnamed protein product [Rotaria socialis]|uniref:Uncharacterized protein n=1 Tax=Rotaria socialis TaxID=392032 RepID=A0A818RM77_9BILA|nr:unnamed protein product [Rotaria socialis]CAF4766393.1 unnamed protein product [Rotaria socialis]
MFINHAIRFLLIIILIFIIIPASSTLENSEQQYVDDIFIKSDLIATIFPLIHRQPSIDKAINLHGQSIFNKDNMQSAEKQFHSVEKTKNSMKFSRDKRGWFFTNSEKLDKNADFMSNIKMQQGVFGQKIWRLTAPRRRPSLLRN